MASEPQRNYREELSPSGLAIVTAEPNRESLEWYFPEVDPGEKPLGARVILQIRRTKKTSSGGIILHTETKETEKWNTQVAKVISMGAIAFCNRSTGEPWPEGAWVKPGDYVRCPRWGGDRWEIKVEGEEESSTFVIFNDHELISEVTRDPRDIKAFIL